MARYVDNDLIEAHKTIEKASGVKNDQPISFIMPTRNNGKTQLSLLKEKDYVNWLKKRTKNSFV